MWGSKPQNTGNLKQNSTPKRKSTETHGVFFFSNEYVTHLLKLVSKTVEWSGDNMALLKSGPIKMF